MNLLDASLASVRRLIGHGAVTKCFVCKRPILPSDGRMKLHGDTIVHRRCATYRIRNRNTSGSRVGFPS